MNPIVISSTCVALKSPKASCRICIDGCPSLALSLTDPNEISVNASLCHQCGYCVVACPVQAIKGNLPARLTSNGSLYADATRLPTVKELLIYYQNGCSTIVVADNESSWLSIIQQTNQTLTQIQLTPFIITIDPLLNDRLASAEPASKRRRSFLKFDLLTHQHQQNAINNKLLTQLFTEYQFFAVTLDNNNCTLCSACLRLCPTMAIKYEQQSFIIDNSRCVGCKLCQDACPEQALSVSDEIRRKNLSSYPFTSHHCTHCKQHYLSVSASAALCPVCRIKKSLNFNTHTILRK